METIDLVDPRKLQWEQGQGGMVAQLIPGGPSTSLNRSAIGEASAQDIFNCSVDNGIWELDQRYRQFAPTPISSSDTVFTDGSATIAIAHCLVGSDISGAWAA
jgi:hypothetical protein